MHEMLSGGAVGRISTDQQIQQPCCRRRDLDGDVAPLIGSGSRPERGYAIDNIEAEPLNKTFGKRRPVGVALH